MIQPSNSIAALTVRAATPDDAPAIIDFQIRMARETEAMELDATIVGKGVGAVFADPTKGHYYVAQIDGQVGGSLLTINEWSDWRNGTVLWIHSVYVRPEHRRRGVFRALYAHVRHKVEADAALRGLRLYVHKDNATAQNTYADLGMDGEHYKLFEWMKG